MEVVRRRCAIVAVVGALCSLPAVTHALSVRVDPKRFDEEMLALEGKLPKKLGGPKHILKPLAWLATPGLYQSVADVGDDPDKMPKFESHLEFGPGPNLHKDVANPQALYEHGPVWRKLRDLPGNEADADDGDRRRVRRRRWKPRQRFPPEPFPLRRNTRRVKAARFVPAPSKVNPS